MLRRWMGFAGLCCWALGVGAVDINSADETQLRTVKGIGHTRAQAILVWRSKHGAFHSAADLRHVKGFGDKTIAKVGPHLSVNGKPLSGAAPIPAEKPPRRRGAL